MRIALVQVASPASESVADRRERVAGLVRSAAGADLIVLPELWDVGYFAFDRYEQEAQTLDGPTVSLMAALACELRTHIHVGSIVETSPTGGLRNTAVLLDPAGEVAMSYSKVHVFGYQSLEAELLESGDRIEVADTPFGVAGSTTCYDLRFPELWRGLVDGGAEIVVVPAAWPAARLEHWRLFTCVRAVENQVVVVACNAVGAQGDAPLGGRSRVVDPWGEVLVEAGDDEGVTFCDVDTADVRATRERFPVLGDRLADYSHLLRNGASK